MATYVEAHRNNRHASARSKRWRHLRKVIVWLLKVMMLAAAQRQRVTAAIIVECVGLLRRVHRCPLRERRDCLLRFGKGGGGEAVAARVDKLVELCNRLRYTWRRLHCAGLNRCHPGRRHCPLGGVQRWRRVAAEGSCWRTLRIGARMACVHVWWRRCPEDVDVRRRCRRGRWRTGSANEIGRRRHNSSCRIARQRQSACTVRRCRRVLSNDTLQLRNLLGVVGAHRLEALSFAQQLLMAL